MSALFAVAGRASRAPRLYNVMSACFTGIGRNRNSHDDATHCALFPWKQGPLTWRHATLHMREIHREPAAYGDSRRATRVEATWMPRAGPTCVAARRTAGRQWETVRRMRVSSPAPAMRFPRLFQFPQRLPLLDLLGWGHPRRGLGLPWGAAAARFTHGRSGPTDRAVRAWSRQCPGLGPVAALR